MNVYAIADLHLSHRRPKPMDVFGPLWTDHTVKLERSWRANVGENDLVLVPGDISWAMTLEDAGPDLDWLGQLPGRKVITKGNHDYWWNSIGKVRRALPPSVRALQYDALLDGPVALAGTRLWQLPWVSSAGLPLLAKEPPAEVTMREREPADSEENMKYVRREILRLEKSLQRAAALRGAETLVAMVHYPPLDHQLRPNEVTDLLERYGVSVCVYGHLHNLHPEGAGVLSRLELGGIRYHLVSCDFTAFVPVRIL